MVLTRDAIASYIWKRFIGHTRHYSNGLNIVRIESPVSESNTFLIVSSENIKYASMEHNIFKEIHSYLICFRILWTLQRASLDLFSIFLSLVKTNKSSTQDDPFTNAFHIQAKTVSPLIHDKC